MIKSDTRIHLDNRGPLKVGGYTSGQFNWVRIGDGTPAGVTIFYKNLYELNALLDAIRAAAEQTEVTVTL